MGSGGHEEVPNKNIASPPVANEDEAELLKRLQAQFGDMDISNLMVDINTEKEDNNGCESEESSVIDPTPEELKAWQDAQFKLGQWAREAKKEKEFTESELAAEALKKRRQEKNKSSSLSFMKHNTNNVEKKEESDSWEEVDNPPDLNGQESAFFTIKEDVEIIGPHPLLTKLAAHDSDMLGGKWLRLYSSGIAGDGLSFYHLLSALRGYDGPTVTIIGTIPSEIHSLTTTTSVATKSVDKLGGGGSGILGIYTATPWKDSGPQFYGTDDCFLFRMDETKEEVHVIRPNPVTSKRSIRNYMYCNTSSSSSSSSTSGGHKSQDGTSSSAAAVYGIGVGGTPSQPRLHLTETLEQCRALPFDATFEDGPLVITTGDEDYENASNYYFDVDVLEVWGVGGEGWQKIALQARHVEQQRVEANLRKARTVDKSQLLDDFRSGFFNPTASGGGESNSLFGHVQHTAGRLDNSSSGDCRPE